VNETAAERPVKQVIVIRRDLRMRRGKEIAQGAHASMAWLSQRVISRMGPDGAVDHLQLSEAEQAWFERSFRKVTVKVTSEEELMAVYEKAQQAGLAVHLITDRGLTEFGGVPTRTCPSAPTTTTSSTRCPATSSCTDSSGTNRQIRSEIAQRRPRASGP
jgi:PTH2 family peptidyl-tRNA hydrolase